mmetsp:Transcript_32140/g.70817  ORF Transcript_32140/g.70817 Transcript_32140/m.70817 type:complete len:216 (-) Transcript_32140:207-854(-)
MNGLEMQPSARCSRGPGDGRRGVGQIGPLLVVVCAQRRRTVIFDPQRETDPDRVAVRTDPGQMDLDLARAYSSIGQPHERYGMGCGHSLVRSVAVYDDETAPGPGPGPDRDPHSPHRADLRAAPTRDLSGHSGERLCWWLGGHEWRWFTSSGWRQRERRQRSYRGSGESLRSLPHIPRVATGGGGHRRREARGRGGRRSGAKLRRKPRGAWFPGK